MDIWTVHTLIYKLCKISFKYPTVMSDMSDDDSGCAVCGEVFSSDTNPRTTCDQCSRDVCEDCYTQCSCDEFSRREGYSRIYPYCDSETFCTECADSHLYLCPIMDCCGWFWSCRNAHPNGDVTCCCYHHHVKEHKAQRRRDVACALGIRPPHGDQSTGTGGGSINDLPPEMMRNIYFRWLELEQELYSNAETRFALFIT